MILKAMDPQHDNHSTVFLRMNTFKDTLHLNL